MIQKRKSSRYSIARQLPPDSQENTNSLGFNIFQYERKIEQKMSQLCKIFLNDAEDNFKDMELVQHYNKQEHMRLCTTKLAYFMDKLSIWVDDKVIDQSFLKRIETKMSAKKTQRMQKIKRIERLTNELTNQLRDSCIQQAEQVICQQLQQYKIKIKSQQALKVAYEIFNKNNNKYNEYMKELENVHEKTTQRFRNLQNKYD